MAPRDRATLLTEAGHHAHRASLHAGWALLLAAMAPALLAASEDPPPAEAPPDPDEVTDLSRMDLNAVMITPASSLAWVRDPSQKGLIRLEPGDDLLGWSVQEIRSDRVLLQRQGETDTLILRDYKNMPPPRSPARRPACRSIRRPAENAYSGQ